MTDNLSENPVSKEVANNIEAVPFSPGAALRGARLQQGLSIDEISNRIKFAPRQIEALESDDFEHLPEPAFVRGFVRSYARLLQLDDAPLLAALPHAPEQSLSLEAQALTEVPYPDIYTERKQNIIWLSAAFSVAVLLGLAAWLLGDKPKESNTQVVAASGTQNVTVETLALPAVQPVSAIPAPEPVVVASAVENPAVAKPAVEKQIAEKPVAEKPVPEKPDSGKIISEKSAIEKAGTAKTAIEKSATEKTGADKKNAEIKNSPQVVPPSAQTSAAPLAKPAVKPAAAGNASGQALIRITFDADSWVSVTDKEGKHLLSQLNHSGTEQSISGNPPFSLTIGYVKAVHLYYKGKAVDLAPYADDEVAHLTLE